MSTALLDLLSRKSRDLSAGVTERAARRLQFRVSLPAPDSMLSRRVSWGLLFGLCIVMISGTMSATTHVTGARASGAWIATTVFVLASVLVYLRSTVRVVFLCGLSACVLEALVPGNTAYVAIITAIVFAGLRLDSS